MLLLQARPMEVQVTRGFSEPRKLQLVPNDTVTVIDHRWVEARSNSLTDTMGFRWDDKGVKMIPHSKCHLLDSLATFLLWLIFLPLCSYSLELSEWKGQNQKTLMVGGFPASICVPCRSASPSTVTSPSSMTSNFLLPNPRPVSYIAIPVKGSMQPKGHGDINPVRGWGTPEGSDKSVAHHFLISF